MELSYRILQQEVSPLLFFKEWTSIKSKHFPWRQGWGHIVFHASSQALLQPICQAQGLLQTTKHTPMNVTTSNRTHHSSSSKWNNLLVKKYTSENTIYQLLISTLLLGPLFSSFKKSVNSLNKTLNFSTRNMMTIFWIWKERKLKKRSIQSASRNQNLELTMWYVPSVESNSKII